MTTALTTPEKAVTVRSLIANPAMQARFKEVLKDKSEQFVSSLINISNSMKDVEPHSVVQSAMVAAALDLPIDRNLGFAWIVPFKNKGQKQAQFQMGFKGFIQLALRSGQYKRMNARAINQEALDGFDDVGEPKIDWQKIDEVKPTSGYVFAFQLVNGFTKCAYWSKQRVEEHAKRYSQSFRGGYDSPWKTHFDEMALKTVIKNELPKWGIMSIQMQQAVEKDQGVIDVDGNVEFLDNQPEVKTPNFGDERQLPSPPIEVASKTSQKKPARIPVQADMGEVTIVEPAPEPPTARSFEEVVDGPPAGEPIVNPAVNALVAAINENGLRSEQVIKFCIDRKLIAQDGRTVVDIYSIKPDKLEKLTAQMKNLAEEIRKIEV